MTLGIVSSWRGCRHERVCVRCDSVRLQPGPLEKGSSAESIDKRSRGLKTISLHCGDSNSYSIDSAEDTRRQKSRAQRQTQHMSHRVKGGTKAIRRARDGVMQGSTNLIST